MKTAYKFLITCATAASVLGFASGAKAETAAGSAAFSINNAGVVTGVAMSAAVSDADTLAVAMNTQIGNATYALGSMTTITAPAWVRPADGAGQVAATGEVAAVGTSIHIYDGEPEYSSDYRSSSEEAEDAYNSGYNTGYNDGFGQGESFGYSNGFWDGYSNGYGQGESVGFNNGYNTGFNDGYNTGFNDGSAFGNPL